MLDRASTFSDPEVVRLLKTRFIPVAIGQAYQRRQKDAEGRFYQRIANQGPRKVGRGTTQGLYVATADGRFLGFNNNRGGDRVKALMKKALEQFQAPTATPIEAGPVDGRYHAPLPGGGMVVRVQAKILGGYEPTLPVLIFAKLKSGMSPEINAIATVALVITAVLGIWAERFTRRLNKENG